MKQCKELVLKAKEGINFEITEGDNNQIVITAFNVTTTDTCSENYANPPIPDGYEHICGEWNNGFVIERKSDGSQFVWVPVGSLDEHKLDSESVKKYGGFYISRFNISKSLDGKPQSIQGEFPWVCITFDEAMILAESMEQSESIESHLTHNQEYDYVLKWFVSSHVATSWELYENSTSLGNYRNSKKGTKKLAKTGSREEWCYNNIYDFIGNVFEWTDGIGETTLRGGSFYNYGSDNPASYRSGGYSAFVCNVNVGFRVVLYIK